VEHDYGLEGVVQLEYVQWRIIVKGWLGLDMCVVRICTVVSVRVLGGERDFTAGCFQSSCAVDVFYQVRCRVCVREDIWKRQ
jgi:hypothetical protein